MTKRLIEDRNFDDLAERFEKRIYGKLKGQIRQAVIWRDLEETHPHLNNTSLNILDIGAGLGQFTLKLAQQNHNVTYSDISEQLYLLAHKQAEQLQITEKIHWYNQAYQDLLANNELAQMDLILCHAVIEWLAEPESLLPALAKQLKPEGKLSFCFYNPAGMTYRNLIAGNFNHIEQRQNNNYQADKQTLTPPNPPNVLEIKRWLNEAGFEIIKESGIRVFTDYAIDKQRGGHQHPEQVLAKELAFSDQYPYHHIGRYIHVMAKKL